MKFLISIIIFLFLLPINLLAECDLEISFIKGSNEEGQKESFSDDILNQLKHLPFNSFKLLDKKKSKIEVGKAVSFNFYDGRHSVDFVPTNITSKKVQAMLKWVEEPKTNLINTKMWFEKNKSIVYGSQTGKKCKVINVNIDCR